MQSDDLATPSIETVEVGGALPFRRLPRRDRWLHWSVLVAASGVMLVAVSMRVRPDDRIEFRLAPGHPLPEICQSRAVLGIDCPGCGLTRCFVHAVHGRFDAAIHANAAGLLVALLVTIQVPYRLWRLCRPCDVVWRSRDLILVLTIPLVLLWAQWAAKLFAGA